MEHVIPELSYLVITGVDLPSVSLHHEVANHYPLSYTRVACIPTDALTNSILIHLPPHPVVQLFELIPSILKDPIRRVGLHVFKSQGTQFLPNFHFGIVL
jgi:hypothetical protein